MEKILLNGAAWDAPAGSRLSDLMQAHGDFKMPCGGRGHCGKCRVTVRGSVSLPDELERQLLSEGELTRGVRLACRTYLTGSAQVTWETGENLQHAPQTALAPGAVPMFEKLGAVVDLGTTTLAAQLYSREGLLAACGSDNPQAAFGADVISRMERALAGEGKALAQAACGGIGKLLSRLAEEAEVPVREIDTVVITGNTAMLYLLTQRDPEPLTHAPFQADWLGDQWLEGAALALPCPEARVYLPRCISAFVGADITTALLAAELLSGSPRRMLVDIGTNGEIVLWEKGRLHCCSTAAGPAFEGAGLSMGMQAEAGAVSHVTATPQGLRVQVIGEVPPRGICGSGVVDAVRCLLETGQLDETGALEEDTAVIADPVALTQGDIRMVQLAKSAICAGMQTMLHRAGLEIGQLEELLIAGGFGSYLELSSARRIGLLPEDTDLSKTTVLGNGALTGAARLLLDSRLLEQTQTVADLALPVNLAADPYFSETYMMGMLFPE